MRGFLRIGRANLQMKILDLFSGIGGFSLGLERAGFETVAFCEIDPYCRQVLAQHWPRVLIYEDVKHVTAERLRARGIIPNIITGGFPCQDVSKLGKRAGLENGTRTGLWSELARIIGDVRPEYAVLENVTGLFSLGIERVLGDLAALGYDAEWHVIPAAAIGAEHLRERVFIIAYPNMQQHDDNAGLHGSKRDVGAVIADAGSGGRERRGDGGQVVADAGNFGPRLDLAGAIAPDFPREYRNIRPLLVRGFSRIPNRVDRVKALGNTIVPQIAELIGNAINDYESNIDQFSQ